MDLCQAAATPSSSPTSGISLSWTNHDPDKFLIIIAEDP